MKKSVAVLFIVGVLLCTLALASPQSGQRPTGPPPNGSPPRGPRPSGPPPSGVPPHGRGISPRNNSTSSSSG